MGELMDARAARSLTNQNEWAGIVEKIRSAVSKGESSITVRDLSSAHAKQLNILKYNLVYNSSGIKCRIEW